MFSKDAGNKPMSSVIQQDVDPSASWDLIAEIGDGAFGKVHKVWTAAADTWCSCSSCSSYFLRPAGPEQEDQGACSHEVRGDQGWGGAERLHGGD